MRNFHGCVFYSMGPRSWSRRLTIAWRTAGKLGYGGPLLRFVPLRLCEATVLQERVGALDRERVTVKTLLGWPLEVIKPEFFFQLLMRLFADPSPP